MKAFIFDLDGVLVDTAKYHYLAWKEIANQHSLKFDHSLNEKLKGVSRQQSLEIILRENNMNSTQYNIGGMLDNKNDIYLEYIMSIDHSELLPGSEDLLIAAKHRSITVCLGSASKNAKLILKKTGIFDCFDFIVDGHDVKLAKPDPEVFLCSSKKFGLEGKDCLVFEDSLAGIEAAKIAKMRTIGIGEKEILSTADDVIPDLSFFDIHQFN